MTLMSVGDLSKSFHMRRHSTELKLALERYGTEATTGRTANLAQTVKGDFTAVAGLERSLTQLEGYRSATNEAAAFAAAMQETLGTVGTLASGGASGLIQASMSTSSNVILSAGMDVKQRFVSAVAALNTRAADRTLLGGADTTTAAIAPAEDILVALRTLTAGMTSAASIDAAVVAWFDDPAGYETLAYQGSSTPLAPFQLGEGEDVSLTITANNSQIRDTLKGLALGALVGEGALTFDRPEQMALARRAGEHMLTSASAITYLQADLGAVEARIDEAATRNSAESASLQLALSAIVSVDPYEVASALQETQTQLETLYTITARMSQLHLVDFLR
jgi:flagellar hook-associated protein 3 FlgL